jgi:hypothetical protein
MANTKETLSTDAIRLLLSKVRATGAFLESAGAELTKFERDEQRGAFDCYIEDLEHALDSLASVKVLAKELEEKVKDILTVSSRGVV